MTATMKALTREQVRRVDALAIEELGIPGVVLMENAGRNAAERIRLHYVQSGATRVVIFCGPGNNGGDGFVIARQLANAGIDPLVYLAGDPTRLSPDCQTNHNIAQAMGITVTVISDAAAGDAATADVRDGDVVVDALLGTGFRGEVRQPLAALIQGLNAAHKRLVVAIDVPSGLDCDTGTVGNVAVQADLTITFAADKVGFSKPSARDHVGQVVVCDIGAPPGLAQGLRP
jgi:NAD(P)H-hydrate epimerase